MDAPGKGKPNTAKLARTRAMPPTNTKAIVKSVFQVAVFCTLILLYRLVLAQNDLGNQGKELEEEHPENKICHGQKKPPLFHLTQQQETAQRCNHKGHTIMDQAEILGMCSRYRQPPYQSQHHCSQHHFVEEGLFFVPLKPLQQADQQSTYHQYTAVTNGVYTSQH